MTHDLDSVYRLPIAERQAEIVAAVDANQVTIITAETGAGKSTQVPQYLAEHGYQRVIVTQPRILAARNLSMRVREEYSWRLSRDATNLVGYRTAPERDDHPDNQILYCTDGLQLVRELTGLGTGERQVLVLDEIHEWNENMEVLVAWAKKRCQEDAHFKVVLMSATIEVGSLAAYFNTSAVTSVPGRTHPVEKRHGQDLVTEIAQLLETRVCNMLVFLPGKAEIESVAEVLNPIAGKGVPIIPLHGQLEAEAQQRAFASYPHGKVILATNVAQTSITIDDIDVVVDSGLERRAEVRNGVEGLFIEQVSRADCLQRAGRAGRTKAGLYILAQLGTLPCLPLTERPEYGVPEIMRKHLDRLVLRLASIGIDIENLNFYHAPSRGTIKLAKRTLVALGALANDGSVTDIGHRMERFPVESSYARMLVEAEHCSQEVQARLATIIAIQEVGGIIKGGTRFSGWRRLTQQTRSDLLAQYEVYCKCQDIDPETLEEMGIITKNVDKAKDVNERLNRDLNLGEVELIAIEPDAIDQLLRCIVAGQLHNLWLAEPSGEAMHLSTKKWRKLSSSTVVRHANLLAGVPFDLEIPIGEGLETLHLVNELTAVEPRWLYELAPDIFKVSKGSTYYDPHLGMLAQKSQVKYRARGFEVTGTPLLDRTPETKRQFTAFYSAWVFGQLEHERQLIAATTGQHIPQVPRKRIEQRVQAIAEGAITVHELSKQQRMALSTLTKLATYFGSDAIPEIPKDTERYYHKRRHGFRHDHHHRKGKHHDRRKRR